MKRLKILMVAEWFYPDSLGGSDRVIFETSKRLVERGHRVYVLTRKFNPQALEREVIEGIQVYRYNTNFKNSFVFYFTTAMNARKTFKKLVKEVPFDIINFHHFLSAFGINLTRESRKIPKVYTFYASYYEEFRDKVTFVLKKNWCNQVMIRGISSILRRIEGYNLNCCQKIITLSKFSKEKANSIYPISSSTVAVIPGGVDINKFKSVQDKKAIRERLNLPQDKIVLLTVRRLYHRMGLENLIQAMSYITKEIENIILLIVGKGPLRAQLEGLVKDLKLKEYVKFAGLVEEDQLPLYYQASDLFILPTRALEGFGMATLEALASSLPVLGTPIGGTKEILGPLNKELLFKNINPSSMAQSILKFIHSKDREELGRQAREYVLKNYQWERAVKRIEDLYHTLIGKEA